MRRVCLNKMSSELVNWISIIGSFLSLIGVIIALVQIIKTRRVAEAAKDASLQTQKAISRNLLLSDVLNCVKHIDEIRLYLRGENYELAQVRANDLNSQLIQINAVVNASNQITQVELEELFIEVSKIRLDLRKRIEGNKAKINVVKINAQLDLVSDNLNKLIGEIKIAIEKGA